MTAAGAELLLLLLLLCDLAASDFCAAAADLCDLAAGAELLCCCLRTTGAEGSDFWTDDCDLCAGASDLLPADWGFSAQMTVISVLREKIYLQLTVLSVPKAVMPLISGSCLP